ncbi:MAG: glycosyltransferase, partial [bacterium]|nr:glycosyltransferase [bacterium]
MSDKIPCSVGILTLNNGQTLRRCLDSLKDFAEIIICDGNSTDNTLEIAREYEAKIIKQYDSNKPNLRCVKDKANVRMKNMLASSYDWYFFMDSDDTLSPGVIEEIRKITTNQRPEFLVYRMPTRIFIDGKEIRHEASYPSYQTRLINRKIKPYFKGKVHERLEFDRLKYKVGELQSRYDFHWPMERVLNFWKYQ